MADFSMRAKVTGSKKRLDALPKRATKALRAAFKTVGRRFLGRLKTERLSGRPGLNKRTSELARSFQMEIGGDALADLYLKVYTRAKQARIQEKGGVVRPVNSKYLAIPIGGAVTPAGVAKGSPRDFKDTIVARSKAGNLIIFQKLGKTKSGKQRTRRFVRAGSDTAERSSVIPLFLLKKEVTIPPRLGMAALWADMKDERMATLRSALRPVLRGTQ